MFEQAPALNGAVPAAAVSADPMLIRTSGSCALGGRSLQHVLRLFETYWGPTPGGDVRLFVETLLGPGATCNCVGVWGNVQLFERACI
jgi:hypothetical protein